MQIACAVTTAPRKVSYLESTLESIDAAGFERPLVSYDETLALGSYRNFKRTVLELLESSPTADAYLIFQDDISVARGLRQWIEKNFWPESPEKIGVASLYCAVPHCFNRQGWHKLALQPSDSSEVDTDGVVEIVAKSLAERGRCYPEQHFRHVVDLKLVRRFSDSWLLCGRITERMHLGKIMPEKPAWFMVYPDENGVPYPSQAQPWGMAYGALALVLPRENARRIVEKCAHPESRTKTDIHVAETCCRLGLSFWMHTPSFVEHVGEVSSLHDRGINDFRKAGEYFCKEAVA